MDGYGIESEIGCDLTMQGNWLRNTTITKHNTQFFSTGIDKLEIIDIRIYTFIAAVTLYLAKVFLHTVLFYYNTIRKFSEKVQTLLH